MPRVHTAKAAKDYPEKGIVKGQTYYYWSFFRGSKIMSATPPRQSQLCNNKMAAAYEAGENLEDFDGSDPKDAVSAIEDAISQIQEVAEEYRDSADRIRETFSESPTADECEEKADGLEDWISTLEEVKDEIDRMGLEDFFDEGAISAGLEDELGREPTEIEVEVEKQRLLNSNDFDWDHEYIDQEAVEHAIHEHLDPVASCPL